MKNTPSVLWFKAASPDSVAQHRQVADQVPWQ